MTDNKRDNASQDAYVLGAKADKLSPKAVAFLQGFLACAQAMAEKGEHTNESRPDNQTNR